MLVAFKLRVFNLNFAYQNMAVIHMQVSSGKVPSPLPARDKKIIRAGAGLEKTFPGIPKSQSLKAFVIFL